MATVLFVCLQKPAGPRSAKRYSLKPPAIATKHSPLARLPPPTSTPKSSTSCANATSTSPTASPSY